MHIKSRTASANSDSEPKKGQNMQYIAYLILILNLLRPLSCICIYIVDSFVYELLNDFTCRCVWWLIPTFIYTLNKFSIHLFVAMRTRLSLRKGIKWSLSLKIGFALMTSDVLLLLFTPFNILVFGTMQYVNKRCVWTPDELFNNISVVGAWTIISDFTISIYCLFVFILPLRKLIQFERNVTNITTTSTQKNGQEQVQSKATKNEIELMVQRIMFYSTIMLVTVMASYVVFMMYFPYALYAAALDLTLNAYCVVMQFTPIDDEEIDCIDSFVGRWFVQIVQCKCRCKHGIMGKEKDGNVTITVQV